MFSSIQFSSAAQSCLTLCDPMNCSTPGLPRPLSWLHGCKCGLIYAEVYCKGCVLWCRQCTVKVVSLDLEKCNHVGELWMLHITPSWRCLWGFCSSLEISPGISLEGMMLRLKLQYFGHLMRRVDSLEKTLMLGGIEGRRRRGWQRMRWMDGITDFMDVSLSEVLELVKSWTGRPGMLRLMGSQRVRREWVPELNWTG